MTFALRDDNARVDLLPAAIELLTQGPPEEEGIIGHKMAPFRDAGGMRGRKRLVEWANYNLKENQQPRPMGGVHPSAIYSGNELEFVLKCWGRRTWYDLDQLRGKKNPTKFELGQLRLITWDWFLDHESRLLTALDAGVTAGTLSGNKWDVASGTTIRRDVLTNQRNASISTYGRKTPNLFAASKQVYDVLEYAAELTGLLGGTVQLVNQAGDYESGGQHGGQFADWLRKHGFKYVYVGNSANWFTLKKAYMLHVSDEGMDYSETFDTASTVFDSQDANTEPEVYDYLKDGKQLNLNVQHWATEKVNYGTSGRVLTVLT